MKIMPEGMYQSDRCKFCAEFGEKMRPRVCQNCFEMAVELMKGEGWHAPDSQKQDSNWIPVESQMPPIEQYVLLSSETSDIALGWLRADGTWEVDLPRGMEFEPLFWRVPPQVPKP